MQTICVGSVDEIKRRGSVSINDITVHFLNNTFYAFKNQCPHMPNKSKLTHSQVCPRTLTVQCPLHQFRFSLIDGLNEQEGLRKLGRLLIGQVSIENNQLFVTV
ncbi:Rieske (2Fe-2S) protein [Spirosoma pomorum]